MNLIGDAPFRIGEWRIDTAVDEISRDGTTVKLEPRTMRILVCLAERAGEVVSVKELLDAVWKDLVVTPYSVYQAISVLRRTLGDDPKDPSYIANVPRRGYRLVAAVGPETSESQNSVTLSAETAPGPDLEEERTAVTGESQPVTDEGPGDEGLPVNRRVRLLYGSFFLALLVLAGGTWWVLLRLGHEHPASASLAQAPPDTTRPGEATSVVFTPPHHSVAVLPFTNLSGDPKQEYFSDGMTEEVINALSQVAALKVTARTSSFSFKGKDTDVGDIARKLNVAAILEGSVRRSGTRVRITAQLINAVDGFHIWSQDYDRELNNVLAMQTEIAKAVAQELQAKLLGDEAPRIELGGTRSPAAFDAYLRGAKAFGTERGTRDFQSAIAAYTEAIRLDPGYALAFAGRSLALNGYAVEFATGPAVRESFHKAEADARQALALAPELVEGQLAMARSFANGSLDFPQATEAYERALALAPGNAEVLRESGRFALVMGRFDAGLAAARRAVVLDPLNSSSHYRLGVGLFLARRYREAVTVLAEAIALDADHPHAYAYRGLAYYLLGEMKDAGASCEIKRDHWLSQWCLAMVYEKLGRHAEAEAEVTKVKVTNGDDAAVQYAEIYAQWGITDKALDWLDTAMRVRDPGLERLKTDPLIDPLRKEPRFQGIERELKFPP